MGVRRTGWGVSPAGEKGGRTGECRIEGVAWCSESGSVFALGRRSSTRRHITNTPGRRPALRHGRSLIPAEVPGERPGSLAQGEKLIAASGAGFLDGLLDRFAGFARALLNPAQ